MSRVSRLEHFADKDPSNSILLCDLLDGLLTDGRVDDAQARARRVPEDLRAPVDIQFREARCALTGQGFTAAPGILQALPKESPYATGTLHHDVARAQLALGLTDEAHRIVESIPVKTPGHAMGVPMDFIFRLRELVRPGS